VYLSPYKGRPILNRILWVNQNPLDCVFKIGGRPFIYLEAKGLKKGLPSLKTLDGLRIVEYAKLYGIRYVVFTNFLKMYIVNIQPTQP